LKRILWLCGKKGDFPLPFIQEMEEKTQVAIEVREWEEDSSLQGYEGVFLLADALSLTFEEMIRFAFQKSFNPLKIRLFPWEEVKRLYGVPSAHKTWERFFVEALATLNHPLPLSVVHHFPERRVLLLPHSAENLKQALEQAGFVVASPLESVTIARQGINFSLYAPSFQTTVGAIVVVPEWQEETPFLIPQEVEETRKILPLSSFSTLLLQREWRKRTIVFLMPKGNQSKAEWRETFRLTQELAGERKARVWVLAEEVFVAGSSFEAMYREARGEGVIFEKVDLSKLSLRPSRDMRQIWVEFQSERDAYPLRIQADWVAYSYKRTCLPFLLPSLWKEPFFPSSLNDLENPNLQSFASSLRGIFVSSQYDEDDFPSLLQSLESYFREGIFSLSSGGTVDEEKCVLCLTCMRTCPWKAVEIDGKTRGKKAKINWEQCHLCGMCFAFCPASAIVVNSLPQRDFLFIRDLRGE